MAEAHTAPSIQTAGPDLAEMRAYLEANNGIAGLEIFEPREVAAIVAQFHRDGFVVVGNILDCDQIAFLAAGCAEVIGEVLALDTRSTGNRGSHRYSFGGSSLTRSQLHRPAWQMLLGLGSVTRLLDEIFQSSDYILRAASGDFCLPGATGYQPLHADVGDYISASATPFSAFRDPLGRVSLGDLPCPYVCVNFLPQDVTRLNGPTRQIPGTQTSRACIPKLEEEPEWMRLSTVCPVPAGSIMIRDTRAWHGGTPNVSDQIRSIPNLEFYAPWFREPMVPGISFADHRQLPERARQLTRYSVCDSSVEFVTGTTLRAP